MSRKPKWSAERWLVYKTYTADDGSTYVLFLQRSVAVVARTPAGQPNWNQSDDLARVFYNEVDAIAAALLHEGCPVKRSYTSLGPLTEANWDDPWEPQDFEEEGPYDAARFES